MDELLKHLLQSDLGSDLNNVAMLVFRLLFALELFRVHGLKKFRVEHGQTEHIPNPLHLPEKLNNLVATLSDTIVPFLIMFGVGTRIAVLPTLGVTAIGYFVVHRKDSIEIRDIPYMYTLCLLFIVVVGAGTFSLDHLLLDML